MLLDKSPPFLPMLKPVIPVLPQQDKHALLQQPRELAVQLWE